MIMKIRRIDEGAQCYVCPGKSEKTSIQEVIFQLVLKEKKAHLGALGVRCGRRRNGSSVREGVLSCLLQCLWSLERFLTIRAQQMFVEGTNS